jgi:hypothetical protein
MLYKETITLTKGHTDTLRPVFTYMDIVKFPLMENFESAGLNFMPIAGSAPIEKTQDAALVFQYNKEINNFSGIITLPYADTIPFFEIKTTTPLYLNSQSVSDCFVEMNYRFTHDVEVGLYCHSTNTSYRTRQVPIVIVKGYSDAQWDKIYINLTDEMNDATLSMSMTHFDLYIKGGVPSGEKARLLFDNIKIVYR